MILQILAVVAFHALPALTLVQGLPVPPGPGSALVIILFALPIPLLIFGRDIAFLRDGAGYRAIYRISMISFVLVLDLFLASLLHLLIRLVVRIGGWGVPARTTVLVVFALAALHVLWGLVNARRLRVRTLHFPAEGFPERWTGRRILFFSDTHYGTLNGPGMAERLVRTVESLKPDLIICGGDLFDGPRGRYGSTLAVLARLQAPLGILAVLGNHDYFYLTRPGSSRDLLRRQRNRETMPLDGGGRLASVKKALPWRFLENESAAIDGVTFVGLRPFSRPDEAAARRVLDELEPTEPTILINHKPELYREAAAAGVDLQLSGHTHGGPVFPVNIVMRILLDGRHWGTSHIDGMVMDTSSGSGISLWYPRTAGRHEVVLVELGTES